MAKRVQAIPVDYGGIWFRQVHILKLKAFEWWLKDHQRCSLPLNLNNSGFGEEQMTKAIHQYMPKKRWKMMMTLSQKPQIYSTHSLRGWNTFNWELKNYLLSIHRISGNTISLCNSERLQTNMPLPANPTQIYIMQAPLHESSYQADQQKVYQMICNVVSGSNSWPGSMTQEWRQVLAVLKLREHYDGASSKSVESKMLKNASSHIIIRAKWHFHKKQHGL